MDLKEYQKKARSTAIYPNIGNNFAYVALGLADEVGELLEKASQGADLPELAKELGDVCWYVAQAASEINVDLGELPSGNTETTTGFGILTDMVITSSKVAGKAKKAIRDDEGSITEEKRKDIISLLIKQLALIHTYAQYIRTTAEVVRRANIDKLFDRKDRGVLKGSGDNR